MCEWCKDLRNIEPACYIGTDDKELSDWLNDQHQKNTSYTLTDQTQI